MRTRRLWTVRIILESFHAARPMTPSWWQRSPRHYIAAQIIGGVIDVWAAHLMFELPVWQVSLHVRTGAGQMVG